MNKYPLMFFNDEEYNTIEAMTACIIPSDNDTPGAKEAEAVLFIDKSLAGFFSHLQIFYKQGIRELNNLSESKFRNTFDKLSKYKQDSILLEIDGSNKGNNITFLEHFFQVVYEHTLEGTFGDPLYGGNKNTVGWKLIGFPGVQWGYTSEQMQIGYDTSQIETLTLRDLITSRGEKNERRY